MKNHFKLMLFAATLLTTTSCQKLDNPGISEQALKIPEKISNVPGGGGGAGASIGAYDPSVGYYLSSWSGGIRLSSIIYRLGPILNGEAVAGIDAMAVPNNGNVTTIGPYIFHTTLVPTNSANFLQDINLFGQAYADFVNKTPQYPGGPLKQANLPKASNFINSSYTDGGGWTQVVTKGMVVRDSSSPSTFTIKDGDFEPTVYEEHLDIMLLPVLTLNGVSYDIGGVEDDNHGYFKEVSGTNDANGSKVQLYGIYGNYTRSGALISTTDLRIYTSPTTYFTYSGTF